METTEFIAKRKELKELIDAKKRELGKLEHNYIRENCPYKTGDKVRIDTPEYVGNRPVSEDLEEEYHNFLKREWFNKPGKRTMSEHCAFTAKYFANWQKEQLIDKACEWWAKYLVGYLQFDEQIIDDFRKAMEAKK